MDRPHSAQCRLGASKARAWQEPGSSEHLSLVLFLFLFHLPEMEARSLAREWRGPPGRWKPSSKKPHRAHAALPAATASQHTTETPPGHHHKNTPLQGVAGKWQCPEI